jgi:cytoskeletal protein RodZ
MLDSFFMGGFMFQIVPIFIGIIFVIVIGGILFSVFKGIRQWHKNEQSPKLSVPAMVKSKRADVSRRSNIHHQQDNHHHHTSSTHTRYYVTFEFESGDRSEFHISGKEYGLLSEDDTGMLTFQGTRYLDFERKIMKKENI